MAVLAIAKTNARVHNPPGPFHAVVTMREGKKAARKIAVQWNFTQKGADLYLDAKNLQELFGMLIKLAYLTPFTRKILPLGLPLYNWMGKLGRIWAETQLPFSNRKG